MQTLISSSLRRTGLALALVATATSGAAQTVQPTVSLPNGINLGATSFFDGFGGKSGDLALQGYYAYTHADTIRTNSGAESPLFNRPRVTSSSFIFQALYEFPTAMTVLGGHPGLDVVVPVINLTASFAPPPPGPGLSLKPVGARVGDISAGLFLQWDPVLVRGNPFFVARAEIFTSMPTARYDGNADINIGNNYNVVGAMVATTFILGRDWELSLRPQYLYSYKNTDPASSFPLDIGVANTQAGQVGTLNFALSYGVSPRVRVGLNGYYLQQLSDDKVNGQKVLASRERVLGFGPGVMLDVSKSSKLWFNLYKETSVRNRARNDAALNLRWIYII